jgi:hypothetical protein
VITCVAATGTSSVARGCLLAACCSSPPASLCSSKRSASAPVLLLELHREVDDEGAARPYVSKLLSRPPSEPSASIGRRHLATLQCSTGQREGARRPRWVPHGYASGARQGVQNFVRGQERGQTLTRRDREDQDYLNQRKRKQKTTNRRALLGGCAGKTEVVVTRGGGQKSREPSNAGWLLYKRRGSTEQAPALFYLERKRCRQLRSQAATRGERRTTRCTQMQDEPTTVTKAPYLGVRGRGRTQASVDLPPFQFIPPPSVVRHTSPLLDTRLPRSPDCGEI